ncbi:head-tail connector protein [Pseudomonas sp. LA5]|uniref:head-tail connector protein n=1 Tax=Pseudomonas sp. LA5 TaxID=3027850 RepID=UPI00235F7F2D|nr:head-tail connector protein [Pseudomonas sp. LA5]
MPVIDIDVAMQHLRAEDEDRVLVEAQLGAAEEQASQYMQRRFYADQAALDAALATVPAAILYTRDRYESALAAIDPLGQVDDRQSARDRARQAFADARAAVEMVAQGIVINDAIQAACLLSLGHLYANREDVVTGTITAELPMGSRWLLGPYRTGLGV